MTIYADFNGSAPICEEVRNYLIKRLENGPFANPNAIHTLGTTTMIGMENARSVIAKALGAKPNQIIFNSGSTEGINHVFDSVITDARKKDQDVLVISGIEHSAVYKCAKHCEEKGFNLQIVNTLPNGQIDLKHFNEIVDKYTTKIAMVSIMAANNETGVIQPIEEISKACQKHGIVYFSDTTQYLGKTPFNFNEVGMDYAIMAGHKIGALLGTGVIIAKDPNKLNPFIIGGGQERNLRGGTQNYLGIESMAVAIDTFMNSLDKVQAITQKRLEFEKRVQAAFPDVVIMGSDAPRLATTTYLAYPGLHGQAVQMELESHDIFVTTSSACSDNAPVTSRVLKSMDVSDDIGRGSVRISLCLCSELEDYDKIFEGLEKSFNKLKKIKSF